MVQNKVQPSPGPSRFLHSVIHARPLEFWDVAICIYLNARLHNTGPIGRHGEVKTMITPSSEGTLLTNCREMSA